jgi:hypothetical protein
MRWRIDDHGRLTIAVTKRERRSLQVAQCREPAFESDDFLHELLEPMVTTDEFTWLSEGITDDLTSAPMLGILGDEMPGPDDAQDAIGMALVHVGCRCPERQHRQMYRPVLRRWAFMAYQVTSPQRELAETGECTWDGGDLWGTQNTAEKALAEFDSVEIESGS